MRLTLTKSDAEMILLALKLASDYETDFIQCWNNNTKEKCVRDSMKYIKNFIAIRSKIGKQVKQAEGK